MEKKMLIVSNVVLLVAVVVIYILYFSSRKGANFGGANVIDSKLNGKNQSIAYINTDSVLAHYKYYEEVKGNLENEQKVAEGQLQERVKDLEEYYKRLNTKINLGLIKQSEGEKMFGAKQQEVQEFKSSTSERLIEKEKKMTEELYDSVVSCVKRYNKKANYSYILGYAKGGGIIYASPRNDLTKFIVEGLNKEYEMSKKKK